MLYVFKLILEYICIFFKEHESHQEKRTQKPLTLTRFTHPLPLIKYHDKKLLVSRVSLVSLHQYYTTISTKNYKISS